MASKCIQCGKSKNIDELHDQLCKSCYLDSYNNVIGFKKFTLVVCSICNNYGYGKKFWPALNKDNKLIKTIRKAILENTKFEKKPDIFEVNVDFDNPKNIDAGEKIKKRKPSTKIKINVELYVATNLPFSNSSTNKNGLKYIVKEEQFDIPLKLTFTICDKCTKGQTNYFEGRIQLRNKNNTSYPKAVGFVRNEINKAKTVFITKEAEIKTGVDFFVTSQKFIQPLGKQLQKKFGGELKVTSSLHTRDTQSSKDLYRVDVLLRLTEFNIGDVIEINNKLLLVRSISGKKVIGVDLKTENKNATENYTNKEYEVIATTKDYKEVSVVKRKPELQVIDPEDYQSIKIENSKSVKTKKDLINVVIIEGKVYAV
jgi:nonsense-mediated mRNA decay protein 3